LKSQKLFFCNNLAKQEKQAVCSNYHLWCYQHTIFEKTTSFFALSAAVSHPVTFPPVGFKSKISHQFRSAPTVSRPRNGSPACLAKSLASLEAGIKLSGFNFSPKLNFRIFR